MFNASYFLLLTRQKSPGMSWRRHRRKTSSPRKNFRRPRTSLHRYLSLYIPFPFPRYQIQLSSINGWLQCVMSLWCHTLYLVCMSIKVRIICHSRSNGDITIHRVYCTKLNCTGWWKFGLTDLAWLHQIQCSYLET